jgi:hypothetical protein
VDGIITVTISGGTSLAVGVLMIGQQRLSVLAFNTAHASGFKIIRAKRKTTLATQCLLSERLPSVQISI